jgi:hypothetical protein
VHLAFWQTSSTAEEDAPGAKDSVALFFFIYAIKDFVECSLGSSISTLGDHDDQTDL